MYLLVIRAYVITCPPKVSLVCLACHGNLKRGSTLLLCWIESVSYFVSNSTAYH